MNLIIRPPETQVIHLWNTLLESGTGLATDAGEPFQVIYPGRTNDTHGADIRDAVINSGRGRICGDIEFHTRSSDWYAHGHHRDPAYQKVMLHVVLQDDAGPVVVAGQKVATVSVSRYLNSSLKEAAGLRETVAEFKNPCGELTKKSPDRVSAILEMAGDARLREKAARFQQLLQHREAGQVLYGGIMEALGYSKNKVPFAELAERVPLRLAESLVRRDISGAGSVVRLQALLIGIAGLLPSQRFEKPTGNCHSGGVRSSKYLMTTKNLEGLGAVVGQPQDEKSRDRGVFKQVDDDYIALIENSWQVVDRSAVMPLNSWDLYKVRPANSPVRRMAAMSYLLLRCREQGLYASLREKLADSNSDNPRILETGLLVAAEGYWSRHSDFGQTGTGEVTQLIGTDRAGEIVMNILLPFFVALGRLWGDIVMVDKAIAVYRSYPAGNMNSVERHMINQISLPARLVGTACRRQGLLYIYRSYCVQGKCGECGLNSSKLKAYSCGYFPHFTLA